MSGRRVVVGMSGGVDSTVAAALLLEENWEPHGVTLRMSSPIPLRRDFSADAEQEAAATAAKLGIPHAVVDVRDDFRRCVVSEFIEEYAAGHTPNPCVICNPRVKFEALLRYADEIGAGYASTGHYARVQSGESGRFRLLRGVDRAKDQSYVLHRLTQQQLGRLKLPLGTWTKREVREKARQMNLPVSNRPESQDVCFAPGGRYANFLKHEAPELVQPGEILDTDGRVVGRHDGIAFFTVGQRRGTRVASKERLYVVEIDAAANTVVVGRDEELERQAAVLKDAVLVSGESLPGSVVVSVRIRYNTQDRPATARPLQPGWIEVRFDEPLRAVTPGQSAVLYDGDEVIGGGVIADRRETQEALARAGRESASE